MKSFLIILSLISFNAFAEISRKPAVIDTDKELDELDLDAYEREQMLDSQNEWSEKDDEDQLTEWETKQVIQMKKEIGED